MVVLQRRTVRGKYAAAIGGNRTAVELSGINVVGTVWILYILAGLLSSLGGIARICVTVGVRVLERAEE